MPQQVPRLIVAFAIAAIALILARYFLIPDTFGDIGHYRAAAVDSVAVHQKKYAGQQECALCHGGIMQARLAGNHRGVACESCHGPAASHAANPIESKPSIPAEREFCLRCHSYNPARPSGFPQIDPEEHNSPIPCATCHEPHAPVTPVTPGSCTACHGQIERQKAVSHHASLACTTCHQSPDEHKDNPRAVRPTKPTERAFCGTCHTSGDDRYVPQVDLGNHNPRYVCWQCHYPHFPETE